jgi:hypothetical protein
MDSIENIIKEKIIKSLSIKEKKEDEGYDIKDTIDNVMKNIIGLCVLLFGIYVLRNESFNLGLIICIIGIIILSYNTYWKNIIKN